MDIFTMTSNLGHVFNFENTAHPDYKGIILPHADIYSLHGGFGDFVFQDIKRIIYDLWYSNYKTRQRTLTHTWADVSLIELSILLENSVSYTFANSIGRVHQRRGQFNIFNSLELDSKVQFEKGTLYTTLDIHPRKELLDVLFGRYPELLDPLLNAIASHREYMFFERPLYLSGQMIQLVDKILYLIKCPILDTYHLDLCVTALLGLAIASKLDVSGKRIRYDRKLQIDAQLAELAQLLASEKEFQNISFYAREIGMSATALKQHFREFYSSGIKEYWRELKMQHALNDVANTDKSIDEIAMDYGYNDSSAFTKAFKKIFKDTPTFYRRIKNLGKSDAPE